MWRLEYLYLCGFAVCAGLEDRVSALELFEEQEDVAASSFRHEHWKVALR